ncbi:hypothetical protein RSOLAG1IB_06835 [Rhizoctonia solani AG-1 IB]|uniref:CHAT domain-containing protein n=1 Tax=Thanatephorus cucumeris (strain AG1-IB / isolate 7/3/14) TaxID=1108050 RepID=A0A0B7FB49_THACB|nr:hypothetical protein RSOLAG1IB_06835 [Rhizoctonia solani AG-1 IB]
MILLTACKECADLFVHETNKEFTNSTLGNMPGRNTSDENTPTNLKPEFSTSSVLDNMNHKKLHEKGQFHIAGDYGQPGSRVFDYVVSSYTPTLTALLGSVSTAANRAPQVLAIGMPTTPSHSPLPSVYRELDLLRGHIQDNAGYSQLIGRRVTTTAVLEAMDKYDWVHLACHAHQNVDDATKSGFYLHDGTLDLSTISQRSFRNKGLAYLSACQTATGDEKLPDEAIHLASGMLMAGYRSVIGSMWSVMDNDAPYVADRVYARLMKDGKVGNGEAGRALHYAVAELREKVGEKEYGRWMPYIHIGS